MRCMPDGTDDVRDKKVVSHAHRHVSHARDTNFRSGM